MRGRARLVLPPTDEVTWLSVNCVGHAFALAMRSLVDASGVASHLVRMGHLLESGRLCREFVRAMKCEFDHSFKSRLVHELLAEYDDWHRTKQTCRRCF